MKTHTFIHEIYLGEKCVNKFINFFSISFSKRANSNTWGQHTGVSWCCFYIKKKKKTLLLLTFAIHCHFCPSREMQSFNNSSKSEEPWGRTPRWIFNLWNKHLSELLHLWQISLNDRNSSFLVCAHALVFVQHEACQGLRFEQWMLWTWTCVI